MACCGSKELILKSIAELRSKRKRPKHASVISHAERHYGLSIEEGHDSLSCLFNNGSVFNKPMQAGLASLFVEEDFVEQEEEHHENDSFSSSLEKISSSDKKSVTRLSVFTARKIAAGEHYTKRFISPLFGQC